jgi:hypothetical protein
MVKYLRFTSLFMVCAAAIILVETACHAAPKAQVDQPVHDAGMVTEGMDVTHEFIFKNVGDQDLVVKPKPC